MRLMKIDLRALVDNPDRSRQTKSTPQSDNVLLASPPSPIASAA